MPISKFAVQIAHTLIDFFVEDNKLALPAGYHYGADNSAVLNPYSVSNLGQAAYGFASATLSRFWSAPPPNPQKQKPQRAGIDEIDQTLQMAKHFGLIRNPLHGENIVDSLKTVRAKGNGYNDRSDLVNCLGFDIMDRQYHSDDQITIQDCENIKNFLIHPDNWKDERAGEKLVKAIQEVLKISDEQVQEESRNIPNSFTEMPTEKVEGEDYVFIGQIHSSEVDSTAPLMFIHPEYANCKLIYEKACQIINVLNRRVSISPGLQTFRQRSVSNHSVSAEASHPSAQFEIL